MIDYEGQTLEGKYLIRRLLGEGGMGRVYLGEHAVIGRPVAVKFLHGELTSNEEIVRRFYREAQAAAAIRHKNVIDVFDVGISPAGEPFLVMEYLEGESLSELLARQGTLDLAAARAVLEPSLLALKAAHERGIVHRDLKPDNIFLAREPGGGAPVVKLIDFGISKVGEVAGRTKLTRDGSLLGTPEYMSPEQARGAADLDHRTDLYATGVILYEMLAGERPFVGANFNELLLAVLTEPPRPPREVNPAFPEAAIPVVERALARDPSERYQSAAEMIEALAALPGASAREDLLTLLAPEGLGGGVAAGDLGAPVEKSRTRVAEEVLEQVIRARRKLLGTKRGRLFAGGVAAIVALLVALIIALTAGGGEPDAAPEVTVTITVKGAAAGAEIYWDGYLVTQNPFKVARGEALVPLRVEAKGRKPLKISVAPSSDQVVDVAAKDVQQASGTSHDEKAPAPATAAPQPQGQAPEAAPQPGAQPKKSKRESKVKRFFRNLTNG